MAHLTSMLTKTVLCCFMALPAVAGAEPTSTTAQQASQQAQIATVDSLATWTAVFQAAAEQWVSKDLTGDQWNSPQVASANSFGMYPPILLYAGAAFNLCGAPSQVTQQVNLVQAGFLPANFGAAYSGEYCAVVYPDSGTAMGNGPVGVNGGSPVIPASSIIAYFVAGATGDAEGMLANAPSTFVVSHLAPIIAQNYAGGATVMKFPPATRNSSQSSSPTWQSVQP